MSTRYQRKKGQIDDFQKSIFNEHHSKMKKAIQESKTNGISRCELKQKTTIKTYRILRKHLSSLTKEGVIKEKDRRIFWITYYKQLVTMESILESIKNESTHPLIEVQNYFIDKHKANLKKMYSSHKPLAEAFSELQRDDEILLQSLNKICLNLHAMQCAATTDSGDEKEFITVIDSGSKYDNNTVYVIPKRNLQGLEVVLLRSMPLSMVLREYPIKP